MNLLRMVDWCPQISAVTRPISTSTTDMASVGHQAIGEARITFGIFEAWVYLVDSNHFEYVILMGQWS